MEIEKLTRFILIVAGLLSIIACLLLFVLSARGTGFKHGVEYCQSMPEVCLGDNTLGDRFGA